MIITHTGTSRCSCRWNCWHYCCQSIAVGELVDRSRRTQLLAIGSQRAYGWLWGSHKTPPAHRLKSRGRGARRWGSGTQETSEWRASCQLSWGFSQRRAERKQYKYSTTLIWLEYSIYYRPQCIIGHSIFLTAERISWSLARICSTDNFKSYSKKNPLSYPFPGERV